MSVQHFQQKGQSPHASDSDKFLDDELPLYIPRYTYKSIEQYEQIARIEYARYRDLNPVFFGRYNGQEENHSHDAIYFQYRDDLQQLEHRFGSCCIPHTTTALRVAPADKSRYQRSDIQKLQAFNPTPFFVCSGDENASPKDLLLTKMQSSRAKIFKNHILLSMAPSAIHGFTVGLLVSEISEWVIEMGLKSSVRQWCTSEVPAMDDKKELRIPDASFGPAHPPPGFRKGRPSLVIEVGKTESQPSLEKSARWWLRPDKGGANTCITCKIYKFEKLVIDVWERHVRDEGPVNTDEAVRTHHIIITRSKKGSAEISVRGSPMSVKFSMLMRRLPEAVSTREVDLVIETETLQEIASTIWKEQGL